jgi:hypothetical protein
MADIDIASPGGSAAALKAALVDAISPLILDEGVVISDNDPGTGPGAGKCRISVIDGTTPGTAKIVVYAGTSTTPIVLADDIGSGF